MILQVKDFKDGETVPVEFECKSSDLEVEFEDLNYLTPIRVMGHGEKNLNTLHFCGTISADIERVCGRTLKRVPDSIHQTFDWFYDIKNTDEIDPRPDVRELLILEHPMVFRTPDSDQVIDEFNKKEHEKEEVSPKENPFSALKDYKNSKEK